MTSFLQAITPPLRVLTNVILKIFLKESDIVNYFLNELCIDCETQTKNLWKPVNLFCKYSTHEILIPLLQKFQGFDTINKYQKSQFLYFFDENESISVLGTNKKYQNGKLIKL